MASGIQAFNPSNELVFSSDAFSYRYHGAPTLISSGSIAYRSRNHPSYPDYNFLVEPYIYEFTLPTSTMIPIVGVQANSSTIVDMSSTPIKTSGSTWQVSVRSVSYTNATVPASVAVATPPGVHVFCPYDNTDIGYAAAGIELYNASSNLTFSTRWKPLWIKSVISMASATTAYVSTPQQSSNTMSAPVVLCANAQGDYVRSVNWLEGGMEPNTWGAYGWTISGGYLSRARYVHSGNSYYGDGVSETSKLLATATPLVDGSIL